MLLRALGADTNVLALGGVKLLRTSTGEGRQEVHFDLQDYDYARRCYSVILYLTDTISTALPFRTLAELRDTFAAHEAKLPPSADAKVQRDQFVAARVKAGDALVFNSTVPHWGEANPDIQDRIAIFAHYYPRGTPKPDGQPAISAARRGLIRHGFACPCTECVSHSLVTLALLFLTHTMLFTFKYPPCSPFAFTSARTKNSQTRAPSSPTACRALTTKVRTQMCSHHILKLGDMCRA